MQKGLKIAKEDYHMHKSDEAIPKRQTIVNQVWTSLLLQICYVFVSSFGIVEDTTNMNLSLVEDITYFWLISGVRAVLMFVGLFCYKFSYTSPHIYLRKRCCLKIENSICRHLRTKH